MQNGVGKELRSLNKAYKMQNINNLRDLLTRVGPTSCPYDVNLHMHTIYSDGSLYPIELITQACELQIKNISITDHHSIEAYNEINIWLKKNNSNIINIPTIWNGIEISCLLLNCLVHVIGLGFNLSHTSLSPYTKGEATIGRYLQAKYVINCIHKAGGISILAHPGRYRLPFKELIYEASNIGIDGVETWYDYDYSKEWKPTKFICQSIEKQVKSLGLLSTCGTDTHGRNIRTR